VIDARDKLTGLIRRAIEDEAGLELAVSPGRPTPRGGYDTTWMFAQIGTATYLTIEAAWYPDSASLDLGGAAVERADEAFWQARGLHRGQKNVNHGPLQCHVFVPYADGDRVDLLRGVLPALLAPYHAEKTASSPGLDVVVAASDGTEHHHRVSGDSTLTVLVDGQPVLGIDQHGPGRWIGEQWQRLYSADRLVDRSIAIEGITTEAQWHELELAVGLSRGDLGRLKPWAGDRPKILSGKLSDGRRYDLDSAVTWARERGLAFEDEQRVRADVRGSVHEAASAAPSPGAAVTASTAFPSPPSTAAVTGGQPGRAAPGTLPASQRTARKRR
jgi:hypothetical protein